MCKEEAKPDVISFSAATSASDKGGQCYKSQELANTMQTVNSQSLVNTVCAFAKLDHASTVIFDAIAASATGRLKTINSQSLGNTVWAFVKSCLKELIRLYAATSACDKGG
eukprot:3459423-Karenia_brevis.AAC.1